MAGTVFFSVSMSLDGFIAPESAADLMGPQWMELQQWVFPQRFFRENLHLGEGGEEGRDNDILRETFERTGASVMGKRMFDAGEQAWPQEAPFLTTFREPCAEMGAAAAEMLVERIVNGWRKPEKREIEARFIVRRSAGPLIGERAPARNLSRTAGS